MNDLEGHRLAGTSPSDQLDETASPLHEVRIDLDDDVVGDDAGPLRSRSRVHVADQNTVAETEPEVHGERDGDLSVADAQEGAARGDIWRLDERRGRRLLAERHLDVQSFTAPQDPDLQLIAWLFRRDLEGEVPGAVQLATVEGDDPITRLDPGALGGTRRLDLENPEIETME